MLSVTPGVTYQSASYFDADGDLVDIRVTGSGGGGFKVELAGLATDRADANRITLVGFNSALDGLQMTVTPQALATQPGGTFSNLYTSGYTNVAVMDAETTTSIGGIQLSAAVVSSISLSGIGVGSITLDAGQTPFVDRINSQNAQTQKDSEMYKPVTAYVAFGNIAAASIGSLVINGAISAELGPLAPNPYDSSLTNDFRGVVSVAGHLGEVVGLRSSLTGAIRANSIDSVRIGNIFGEITTRNAASSMAVDMPKAFKGFINVAGHLDLAFTTPLPLGAADIAGQITAGGGISGADRSSQTDTIFLPGGVKSPFINRSATVGIAPVSVDGEAGLSLNSASSIGDLTAGSFAKTFVAVAASSIGAVNATGGPLGGSFQAGTSIGAIALAAGMDSASLVAGTTIGSITLPVGNIKGSFLRAHTIGAIAIADGSISSSSLIATEDVAGVSAYGTIAPGISDVSIVAGRDVGLISGSTHAGSGIESLKIEAGRDVAGITGFSAGMGGTLAGVGITMLNVVANKIGDVTGRSAGGSGIDTATLVARTSDIGAIHGTGWIGGLSQVTAVADVDILSVTGIAEVVGTGIDGGSYEAKRGLIGQITGRGAIGIAGTRFQAIDIINGGIDGILARAIATGTDAMQNVTVNAGTVGPIRAFVDGGVDGNGIVGGSIRAFRGNIDAIDVDVRSTAGSGIVSGKVEAFGDISSFIVQAFNASAVVGGEFVSRGNFGPIIVVSANGGTAIDSAVFKAPGRSQAFPPLFDVESVDPYGNFGLISARAGGADPLASAISNSTFTAIGNIGPIEATSLGGSGITGSIFTADSNGDYKPAAPGRPWLAAGTIDSITVVSAGRNATSGGIANSAFLAANIGNVLVDVQMVEAGDGITGSRFEAITHVYDGFGNYDNTGTIGTITVRNRSNAAITPSSAIDDSVFTAGAAGGIGTITITTGFGAAGITKSQFLLDADIDQNVFTGAIGNIVVDTGRTLFATSWPAGIIDSSFLSAGGIGNITVNSVGVGISGSTFDGKAFSSLPDQINIPGALGTIFVRVPGRNASAVTGSTFRGSSIGNISISLTDNAARGFNTVANSSFTAQTGAIGNVTVVNANSSGSPPGYAILNGIWRAATAIGSVTIVGQTSGAQFIVTGSPIFSFAALSATPSIGPVSVSGGSTVGMIFSTPADMGAMTFQNLAAGSTVSLQVSATAIGDVTISAPGAATANLNLSANATSIGNVSVDGNLSLQAVGTTSMGNVGVGGTATLSAASLRTLGNLSVAKTLTLPQGLSKLVQAGTFSAGALAAVAKGRIVQIGAKGTVGSSIGKVTIGQANRSPGVYQFAFAMFTGQPTSATVGGKNFNAKKGAGALVNGVRLIGGRPA